MNAAIELEYRAIYAELARLMCWALLDQQDGGFWLRRKYDLVTDVVVLDSAGGCREPCRKLLMPASWLFGQTGYAKYSHYQP